MKAVALFHSSFEEILMMDADNLPASDPTYLFNTEEFLATGNLYWHDFSTDPHWIKPEFMALFGLTMQAGEYELEAGQVVLDKRRCWLSLLVYQYMNTHFQYFYRRMYGDKDTHRLAFKITGQPISVSKRHPESIGRFVASSVGPRFCGDTMLHLDAKGMPLFLHRTLSDFEALPQGAHKWRRAHSKPPLTWQNATKSFVGWDVRTIPTRAGGGGWIEEWCVQTAMDTQFRPVPRRLVELERLTVDWMQELAAHDWLQDLPADAKGRG